MIQADTEQLEILTGQIKKLAEDCEECWYLLRSTLNEMDNDSEFLETSRAATIWSHMDEAIVHGEQLKEILLEMARVLSGVPGKYEEIGKYYVRRMEQMTEYMSGLKASYAYYFQEERRQTISELHGANLAPVHKLLREKYKVKGVMEHERK